MLYHGLILNARPVTFKEALFNGMAIDGSLFVPERIPVSNFSVVEKEREFTLHTLGIDVASQFIDDIPLYKFLDIVRNAWNFPIPLRQLDDDLYLLELFHGPTLAFKDVGARFMAGVMSYYLERESREISLVVATSGDTGSAVASGFYNSPRITVYVLYPSGKISPLQEKQITTLGGNIRAIEVEGTFDDCQALVKELFRDTGLLSKHHVTTANSINIARLIPQIVYYFWATAQLSRLTNISENPPIITVPSGNFGNLTAALYAKFMGNPTRKFIAATNVNDVVPKYFLSGMYSPQPSVQTLSNAMDVGSPSNFARIRKLYGGDFMTMVNDIEALSVSDDETLKEMQQTYERYQYIADPHTAVGLAATRKLREKKSGLSPVIVAATAHPAKFPETIKRALGIDIPLPAQLAEAFRRTKNAVKIGKSYSQLRDIFAG